MIRLNMEIHYLKCHGCGKQVSTGFLPIATDTPDKGIIVRAYIECPECIEGKMLDEKFQARTHNQPFDKPDKSGG